MASGSTPPRSPPAKKGPHGSPPPSRSFPGEDQVNSSERVKGPKPLYRSPGLVVSEGRLLLAVGPVVPSRIGEVATEEAPYLFGPRVHAVEKPTGGEVVSLAILHELLRHQQQPQLPLERSSDYGPGFNSPGSSYALRFPRISKLSAAR